MTFNFGLIGYICEGSVDGLYRKGMDWVANDLKGKKAIITGAGKGVERATALAFAQEGMDVALIARTESDLQKKFCYTKRLLLNYLS